MAHISDATLSHLLQVLGYLKAAEFELEQAVEHDDWLLNTIDTDGLSAFRDEIIDYIACNMKVVNDALNFIGIESILDFKNNIVEHIKMTLPQQE